MGSEYVIGILFAAVVIIMAIVVPAALRERKAQKERFDLISSGLAEEIDEPIEGKRTHREMIDGYQIDQGYSIQAADSNDEYSAKNGFLEVWKPKDVTALRVSTPTDPAMGRALNSMMLHHVSLTASRVRFEFMGPVPKDASVHICDAIELAEMAGRPSEQVWQRWEKRGLNPTEIGGRRAARLLLRFGAERPGARKVAHAQLQSPDPEVAALSARLLEDAERLLELLDNDGVPDRIRYQAADFCVEKLGRERVGAALVERVDRGFETDANGRRNMDQMTALVEIMDRLALAEGADAYARRVSEISNIVLPEILPFIARHATREGMIPLLEYRARHKNDHREPMQKLDQAIGVIRERLGEQPAGGLSIADEGEGGLSVTEG